MGTSNPGAVVGRGVEGGTAVPLVNNLTDGGTSAALTAEQGKQLALRIEEVSAPVDSLDSTSNTAPLSAKQGKVLADQLGERTTSQQVDEQIAAALANLPSPESSVPTPTPYPSTSTITVPLDAADPGRAFGAALGDVISIATSCIFAPPVLNTRVERGVCSGFFVLDGTHTLTLDPSWLVLGSGASFVDGSTHQLSNIAGRKFQLVFAWQAGDLVCYVEPRFVVSSDTTPLPPAAPTLAAHDTTATTQPLTITPGTVDSSHGPAATYTVQKSTDGGTTWTSIASGSAIDVTATGLAEATAYRFRAAAVNSVGDTSAWSNVVTVATPAATTPVLEFFAVPASSPRDLSSALDYYFAGRRLDGVVVSGLNTRKSGANLLTNVGPFGAATQQGQYGNLDESWSGPDGIDGVSNDGIPAPVNFGACTGYGNMNPSTTGWGATAPASTTQRRALLISCGIFVAGWKLYASISDNSSEPVELPLASGTNSTRGLRFRGASPGATVRLELRGPDGCGVLGAALVAAA